MQHPFQSAVRLLFLFAVAWGALIFWVAPHPPMVDLPQHAGQIALLKDFVLQSSPWPDDFLINLRTPYLIGYGLALPLSFIMPVAAAMKLLLSLAYIGFVFMCVKIRQRVSSDARLDWLFIPSFFGFSYYWGFFTFLVASPICLLFIYVADRYAEKSDLRRSIALIAAGLLLLLSHGLAFIFGWTAGFGILLMRKLQARPIRLAAALPFAILAAASLVYFMLARQMDAAVITTTIPSDMGPGFMRRIRNGLAFTFLADDQSFHRYILCLLLGALLCAAPLLMRLRIDWRNTSSWIPFVGVLGIFLLGPSRASNTSFLYERFSLFLLPAFAWMFHAGKSGDRAPAGASVMSNGVQILLMVCCASALGIATLKAARFAEESRSFDAALKLLEPGQRSLGMVFDHSSPAAGSRDTYVHYPVWYQAEKHGLTDFNFAWFTPQIVRFRPERRPAVQIGFEWDPGQFDWKQHQGSKYRYFFVRGAKASTESLFSGAECAPRRVYAGGDWAVFDNPCVEKAKAPSSAVAQIRNQSPK